MNFNPMKRVIATISFSHFLFLIAIQLRLAMLECFNMS